MKATSWVRARRCRYWWRRGDGEPAAEFDKNVDSRKGGGCYVQCGARAGRIIIIAVQSAVIVHGVFFLRWNVGVVRECMAVVADFISMWSIVRVITKK